MDTVNFLIYPFLSCVLLILIHVYFGIHILERGIIFIDLSLAQFIGLGIAISFFIGEGVAERYIFSGIFAVIGATILSLNRYIARLINIEAFIGVLYIFSLSSGVLILDRTPHGLEEFKAILNGNILWVTPNEIFSTFIVYSIIGVFHFIFRKQFLALLSEGEKNIIWEFLFFLTFAVVLVKSVQMAGILLVFSFLVIPTLIGRLYTRNITAILMIGWLTGLCMSILGMSLSYKLDFPTSPLIVALLSIVLFLLLIIKSVRRR